MVTVVAPLLVLVVGLFLWFAVASPKVQEVGKIAFFVGLLWLVYMFSQKQIHFG